MMPSPFPGMDPYWEGPFWSAIHSHLSAEIARLLAPQLRPKYVALMNERFVMETTEAVSVTAPSIYPDVGVGESAPAPFDSGGVAVAPPPLEIATLMPAAVPPLTVEIRDVANRRLVTFIEVLSPTDKRGEGREEYLLKRNRILLSSSHLMEIDLLRQGHRVPMRRPLPQAPYFVFLSRAEKRPLTEIWPIALAQPLPRVPVPLLSGDPDVALDLQLVLTTVYDVFGLDRVVDYTRPPEVPLPPSEAAWVEERLRQAGKRA